MFCQFSKVQPESRFKMRLRDPETYFRLLDLEPKNSKPIWLRISEWEGVLDHMAPERPDGAGQIIRRVGMAKRARIA